MAKNKKSRKSRAKRAVVKTQSKLKSIRNVFGMAARNARHIFTVGVLATLFMAHGTITSEAANNEKLERALASTAKAIVVTNVGERHGAFAGNAAGEAVDQFHWATALEKCADPEFRGKRTELACRDDQMDKRVNVYMGAMAWGLVQRLFDSTTSGPRRP